MREFFAYSVPMLLYICIPGGIVGFYYEIPLGFLAAFGGFALFHLHCDLADIKAHLKDIDEVRLEKLRKNLEVDFDMKLDYIHETLREIRDGT